MGNTSLCGATRRRARPMRADDIGGGYSTVLDGRGHQGTITANTRQRLEVGGASHTASRQQVHTRRGAAHGGQKGQVHTASHSNTCQIQHDDRVDARIHRGTNDLNRPHAVARPSRLPREHWFAIAEVEAERQGPRGRHPSQLVQQRRIGHSFETRNHPDFANRQHFSCAAQILNASINPQGSPEGHQACQDCGVDGTPLNRVEIGCVQLVHRAPQISGCEFADVTGHQRLSRELRHRRVVRTLAGARQDRTAMQDINDANYAHIHQPS